MAISTRERNILLLAGLVAVVFAITNLSPAIASIYEQRDENIESISLDIEREQRLIEESVRWRDRRLQVEETQIELSRQIFVGDTVPVIEANIQRELSRNARDSGITINSTRLAERLDTDGWLLVSQEMSFRTNNAANTVEFLNKLKTSEPRLRVTDFSISRNRNQYTGSITVVGFARSDSLLAGESQER